MPLIGSSTRGKLPDSRTAPMMRTWLCALSLSFNLATLAHAQEPEATAADAEAREEDPAEAAAAPADPETAADPVAEPAAAAATAPIEAPVEPSPAPATAATDCAPWAALCVKNDDFAFWPRVRLRTGYELVQADPEILYVGQNDGFFADQMRLGVDAAYRGDLRFRFILDATSLLPGAAANQAVTSTLAAARDLWVAWTPSPWLVVSLGQQFMPTDIEGQTTTTLLPFARRSVATSGVRAGHGNAVLGLSPTRQIGLVVGTGGPMGDANPTMGSLSFEYKLAVSNGNGQNFLGNDNKLPALYGRFGVGYEDLVSLGFGGRFNPRTVGTLPNLYTESDALGFADVTVRLVGVELVAQGIYRSTSLTTLFPEDGGAGQEAGLGATAWLWARKPLGMDLWGIQPAYRFSYFDPSSAFATDQLVENSIGLRWDLPLEVVRLTAFADYTILTELGEGARDLQNDRFTALLQLEL
jgi:hypothetical protein